MRYKKTEEIKRLLVAALNMCDLSRLDSVRKKLAETLRDLEAMDFQSSLMKKADSKIQKKTFTNPSLSLNAIEQEIRRELDKNYPKPKDKLFQE